MNPRWTPILALAVACGDAGDPRSSASSSEATADWPPSWADFEDQVLDLVNQQRFVGATCGSDPMPGGQVPLEMDDTLRRIARLHSEDMAERGFFDHVNPDGDDPFDRMSAAGFAGAYPWGENIAAGSPTPEDVVDAWMNSPPHCENILLGDYRVIGIGLYEDPSLPYSYWWTQDFAGSH
jgi:uncharacterized protein YkwD